MANFAAFIPAKLAPLEIREVEKYIPGQGEILIKNTIIAFNPIEYKMARIGFIPLEYPSILGLSYGGIVESVGNGVTKFKIGDKVAATRNLSIPGNKYGSFQRYVVALETMTAKLPENANIEAAVNVILNLETVIGILTNTLGLDHPNLDKPITSKGKKLLIYGGSSSVGSLCIQYASQAGYTVISTSSPRNNAFVSTLGATKIIDHTQDQSAIVSALIEEGSYDFIVDTISIPSTINITAAVLSAQGGGTLHTLIPPIGPETIPDNVERSFKPYGLQLGPEHSEINKWFFESYLPQGIATGKIIPLPQDKVKGGLNGIEEALTKMQNGVSCVKVVADPWEE